MGRRVGRAPGSAPPGLQYPEAVAHHAGQGELQQVLHAPKALGLVLPLPAGLPLGQGRVGPDPAAQGLVPGPFQALPPVATTNQSDYPHLRGVMQLNEINKFPFYFDASYDKYFIGAEHSFFPDLVDPTNAVIGLDINYKTGASVLTLAYKAQWNPALQTFDVTSSLQASVQF